MYFRTDMAAAAAALCIAAGLAAGTPALAQTDIGAAANVVNKVNADLQGRTRDIKVGDRVFQNEVIATGADGRSQILFRDESSLTVGPDSRVTLDTFVFNPAGGGSTASVNAARGVFRFVSGSMPSNAYQVRTPAGTIGVRGTLFDFIVEDDGTLVIQLLDGQVDLRTSTGGLFTLRDRGQVLTLGRTGIGRLSTRLTDSQRNKLAVIRDFANRQDVVTHPPGDRDGARDILRRTIRPPSGGGPGGTGDGGSPGGGGDGG